MLDEMQEMYVLKIFLHGISIVIPLASVFTFVLAIFMGFPDPLTLISIICIFASIPLSIVCSELKKILHGQIRDYHQIDPNAFMEENLPGDLNQEIEDLLTIQNVSGRKADRQVVEEAKALRFCMEELSVRIQRHDRFQWTWVMKGRMAAKMLKRMLTIYRLKLGPEGWEITPKEQEKIRSTHPLLAADIELDEQGREGKMVEGKKEDLRRILRNMKSKHEDSGS